MLIYLHVCAQPTSKSSANKGFDLAQSSMRRTGNKNDFLCGLAAHHVFHK